MSMWFNLHLKVNNTDGRDSFYSYGQRGPSAYLGFLHALARETCGPSVIMPGVGIIVHDFEISGREQWGRTHFNMPRSTERDTRGAQQLDIPRIHLETSLVFQVDKHPLQMKAFEQQMELAIPTMRFAGGVISVAEIEMAERAGKAFRKRPGFFMKSASLADPEKSPIDVLIEKMAGPDEGRITPASVGYRLLEDPVPNRPGARNSYPHAYADPLLGAVSWHSTRGSEPMALWHLTQESPRLFVYQSTPLAEGDLA